MNAVVKSLNIIPGIGKSTIRDIVDFPIPGIIFKDLTTAFKNPDCMKFFEDEMYRLYRDKGITKVIGIESRGFIMAQVGRDKGAFRLKVLCLKRLLLRTL